MGGSGSGPSTGSRYHTVGGACRLDLAIFLARGFLRPGELVATPWGWWDESPKKLRSSVNVELDLRDEPRYRIWYGITRPDRPPASKEITGALLQTYPHYGGVRWWWQCPGYCGERVRTLYCTSYSESFACRRCHHLRYFSQRLGPFDRLRHRSNKLYAKAGRSPLDQDSFVTKRKGMHWRTFDKLIDEGDEAERRAFRYLTRSFSRRFPGL